MESTNCAGSSKRSQQPNATYAGQRLQKDRAAGLEMRAVNIVNIVNVSANTDMVFPASARRSGGEHD
jgi:hypothetical protein